MTKRKRPIPFRRPAELGTGGAAALAFFLSRYVFHFDAEAQGYLMLLLGGVPGAVTWAVELWRRR